MRRRPHENPITLFSFQDIVTSVTGILILMTLLLTVALVTREFASPARATAAIAETASHVLQDTQAEIAALRQRYQAESAALSQLADIAPAQVQREVFDLRQELNSLGLQVGALRESREHAEASRREWNDRARGFEELESRLQSLQQEIERLAAERQRLMEEDRLIFNPQPSISKTAWLVDLGPAEVIVARVGVREKPQAFPNVAALLRWARTRGPQNDYFVLLVRPGGISAYETVFVALRDAGYDLGVDLIAESQTVIDPENGAGADR